MIAYTPPAVVHYRGRHRDETVQGRRVAAWRDLLEWHGIHVRPRGRRGVTP